MKGAIHYWFIESQSETPENDPVVYWTNGGPVDQVSTLVSGGELAHRQRTRCAFTLNIE